MHNNNLVVIYDDLFAGGAVSLNQALFSSLKNTHAYRITLITGITGSQAEKTRSLSFADDVISYRIPSTRQYIRFLYIFFNTLKSLYLVYRLKKIHHTVSNFTYSSLAAILFCKVFRIPHVYMFHGALSLEKRSFLETSGVNMHSLWIRFVLFSYWLAQYTVIKISTVICFSLYSKQILVSVFKKQKPHVIHVPMTCHPSTRKIRRAARKSLGLDVDSQVFLLPSRIEPRKGYHIFKEAVAMLKLLKPTTFIIAGPVHPQTYYYFHSIFGQTTADITKIRIYFTGEIQHSDLVTFYLAADATIVPSINLETLGMVTLESLSVGTPVIGFPCCATPDILRYVDENLITKDVSAEALADTIHLFSALSASRLQDIQQKCIQHIKSFYNPSTAIEEYQTVINGLTTEKY